MIGNWISGAEADCGTSAYRGRDGLRVAVGNDLVRHQQIDKLSGRDGISNIVNLQFVVFRLQAIFVRSVANQYCDPAVTQVQCHSAAKVAITDNSCGEAGQCCRLGIMLPQKQD
ncbi:MAG: hypothetical protein M3460_14305 [Actinomycetota bacterium]|nr:hypothetical protein [Actinomycetota bacterium]